MKDWAGRKEEIKEQERRKKDSREFEKTCKHDLLVFQFISQVEAHLGRYVQGI